MPSGSCLSESVDIPLRSGQDSGWSEHDVRDRRSATWMSPRAVPVRIWDTISTSLGNSHSETLQLSEAFCSFREFVDVTATLRYEPCTQFINVSQSALHIYFIDGCRVCPLDARYKNRTKQPLV